MNTNNPKTFKHSGDLGDIIFSLPAIRALGGGILYLDPEGGRREPLVSWGNGLFETTKITPKSIESARPLLEAQEYIKEIRYWDGEYVDYNLDTFRMHVKYNNLADSHLAAFGLPFSERDSVWIKYPESKGDLPQVKNLIARSCRYHGNYCFWETLDREVIANALFIGFKEEYDSFLYTFPHMRDLLRIEVNDLVMMAQIIDNCDLFICNQGLPHAIGEALKKPIINEVFRPYPSAVFKREGAQYV